MNTYGGILLALMIFSLVINAIKHGEDKKQEKYNFYKRFFFFVIQAWLFYMAGVFN